MFRGYRDAFRVVFIIGAVLAAGAGVAAWFLMPQIDLDAKEKAHVAARDSERSDSEAVREESGVPVNEIEKRGAARAS